MLAEDADPAAHVWILYADDRGADAMVHRSELSAPCWLRERAPAVIDALDDDVPVRVCQECFGYYAVGPA